MKDNKIVMTFILNDNDIFKVYRYTFIDYHCVKKTKTYSSFKKGKMFFFCVSWWFEGDCGWSNDTNWLFVEFYFYWQFLIDKLI